jgi:uncharacterized protein YukE
VSDEVRIDTDGVGDVGRGLRGDADGVYADASARGTALHGHGVEFGARVTPSAIIGDAQRKYAKALENTEANLRAYKIAAEVLADAAEDIARMFKTTDMNSDAALKKVQDLIDQSVLKANAALGRPADGTVL